MRLYYFLVSACAYLSSPLIVLADESCEDEKCQQQLGKGAKCRGGRCSSNPFDIGCLRNNIKDWTEKRICNSEDPHNAEEKGLCRKSEFDYMEVRIYAQSWDTSIFQAWILQILLSEMLDVPAVIETGKPGQLKTNFYHPSNSIEYGAGSVLETLKEARKVKDCRNSNKVCAHILLEGWNFNSQVRQMIEDDVIEHSKAGGLIGNEGWFIPEFTATQDPSLIHYFGYYQGQENRQKLANRFLPPVSWREYCADFSKDNCTTDDGIASRPPREESEMDRYYFEGSYIGHFNKESDKNNCTKYPTKCTGHFADYPCGSGWTSYAIPVIYHKKIPLRSVPYSYQQLSDIWHAANATKSDVVMYYWFPEPLYETFIGTNASFVRVALPAASNKCLDSRISAEDRCSDNITVQAGDSAGACDDELILLRNQISSVLEEEYLNPKKDEAMRSPSFDALNLFHLTSNYEMSDIFHSTFNNDSPRAGVCEWVANNMARMKDFLPKSHPLRKKEGESHAVLVYFSVAIAAIGIIFVLVTWFAIYRKRDKKVIRNAQIEFLHLLLAGCLLITIGALTLAIPPSDASCSVSTWLVNLGYTLEMVPLLVKVAAVNHMMNAAKRMKRINMKKAQLYRVVFGICALVTVFLVLWTVLDASSKHEEYSFDTNMPEASFPNANTGGHLEEYFVYVQYYCKSNSKLWRLAAIMWHALMLLSATVLAFQSRSVKQGFNETKELVFLIYSNSVFMMLRLIIYFLSGGILDERALGLCCSLAYSVDTIATLIIYFLPKLMKTEKKKKHGFSLLAGLSRRVLIRRSTTNNSRKNSIARKSATNNSRRKENVNRASNPAISRRFSTTKTSVDSALLSSITEEKAPSCEVMREEDPRESALPSTIAERASSCEMVEENPRRSSINTSSPVQNSLMKKETVNVDTCISVASSFLQKSDLEEFSRLIDENVIENSQGLDDKLAPQGDGTENVELIVSSTLAENSKKPFVKSMCSDNSKIAWYKIT